MDSTPPAVHVTGHCYCGGVTYSVTIPQGDRPIFNTYCHCDSCRRAHAAPLYHVVCVDESMFELTAGAELLTEFHKPGASLVRAFCSGCGTRVLNRFPGWKPGGRTPLAFFPNTLDEAHQHPLPDLLRSGDNNRPEECVLEAAVLGAVMG
jgi:hypothetical protein